MNSMSSSERLTVTPREVLGVLGFDPLKAAEPIKSLIVNIQFGDALAFYLRGDQRIFKVDSMSGIKIQRAQVHLAMGYFQTGQREQGIKLVPNFGPGQLVDLFGGGENIDDFGDDGFGGGEHHFAASGSLKEVKAGLRFVRIVASEMADKNIGVNKLHTSRIHGLYRSPYFLLDGACAHGFPVEWSRFRLN